MRTLLVRREDGRSVARRELLPQTERILERIKVFHDNYREHLPLTAARCLHDFIQRWQRFYSDEYTTNQELDVQARLTALAAFHTEFNYQISNFSAVAIRISKRAFVHLQYSIVADPAIREKWTSTFQDEREEQLEKLGATHLLLHGIWAFKVNAAGERTDLVLGEPLRDLSSVQETAEALVLTEWKRVDSDYELERQAQQAYTQAAIYSASSLAPFELADYRYLVLVTKDRLNDKVPPDRIENGITYHYVNIAVNPGSPSQQRPRLRRRGR